MLKEIAVTIANGASVSNEFYADDFLNMLIRVPSGFAGSLSVQAKGLDGEWDYLRYTGHESGTTAHAPMDIPVPGAGWTKDGWYMFPAEAYAAGTLRLISHNNEVAQVQTGAQRVEIKMKGISG